MAHLGFRRSRQATRGQFLPHRPTRHQKLYPRLGNRRLASHHTSAGLRRTVCRSHLTPSILLLHPRLPRRLCHWIQAPARWDHFHPQKSHVSPPLLCLDRCHIHRHQSRHGCHLQAPLSLPRPTPRLPKNPHSRLSGIPLHLLRQVLLHRYIHPGHLELHLYLLTCRLKWHLPHRI